MASGLMAGIPKTTTTRLPMASGLMTSGSIVVPTTRGPMASGLMAGIPKTTTTRLPMASGLMTSGSIVVPTTKRPTTIRPMTSGSIVGY